MALHHCLRTLAVSVGVVAVASAAFASDGGFVSLKGAHFEMGGEIEFEFVATQEDQATTKPNPHFQIDQLYLYPKVDSENLLISADVAIKASTSVFEEVWGRFHGLAGNTWIEIGMNDMFIANVKRKAEEEIILETAFYRSDDMGVQLGGSPTENLGWHLSATTGLALSTKGVTNGGGYPMIHDARNPSDAADQLMFGFGADLKLPIGDHQATALPFGYVGKLMDSDVAFLQGVTGYTGGTQNDKTRYGVNVTYEAGDGYFLGQFLQGRDGGLDRTGYFLQPSWKVDLGERKHFGSVELLYRYSDLDLDMPAAVADPLTWDRQQHVAAALFGVQAGVIMKVEYYVNKETTGAAEVDNDEFLTQLEIKW